MEHLVMSVVGMLLGMAGICLAELSYVLIRYYDIPGFYWPDEKEDENSDM